jgi:hypothetical protein
MTEGVAFVEGKYVPGGEAKIFVFALGFSCTRGGLVRNATGGGAKSLKKRFFPCYFE